MEKTKDIFVWLFGGSGASIVTLIYSRLYKYFAIRFFPYSRKLSKYIALYEVYRLSVDNDDYVIRNSLKVFYDLFGRVRMKLDSIDYSYSGKLILLDSSIYLKFKGVNHNEYMFWILKAPLSSEFDLLHGVYACIDKDRMPKSDKVLLLKAHKKVNVEKKIIGDPKILDYLKS